MAPDDLRGDTRGQMMILSAVILLIGFIALSGMVSRVSQLGSQTAIENERSILDEVGPLADTLDTTICRLKPSSAGFTTVSNTTTLTVGSPVITPDGGTGFALGNVGMLVSGTGIPAGTRVLSYNAPSLTLTASPTSNGGSGRVLTFTPCWPTGAPGSFGLGTATSPTLEVAVASALDQVQALQSMHGLFMDWEVYCTTTSNAQAIAHLFDGSVWLEVRSAVRFPVSSCTQSLACTPPASGAVIACG